MNQSEILSTLKQNATSDGTSQFNFSRDLSVKQSEQEMLEQLEADGYIQQLTISLGYAVYHVL